MKRRINRTEHYAGGASKQSMQQSEKQSCSPSLSLSSLVRRVWSFITLPSSPSAAVFSSSLQNAERASSEAAAGAASVGRSVGRSVVRLVIRKGGVSSARTVDRRTRTQLPCQHVCTSSVAGRDVRPALDIFMFHLVNCVQIWTGVALGIFRRVSPNLTAKCPSLEMLYGRLAGPASPLRSSLFHTPGDGNGPFRWSHSPRSNSEVVGVNSIIIITAVIQFS